MIESCITFLPTNNLEETMDFYTRIVGLRVFQTMGQCVILDCGKGYWGFCRYDDGRELATGVCLSLNCENREEVDRRYRSFLEQGVETVQPPQHHKTFPVYSFFCHDPNGYLLELQKIDEREG